MKRALAAFTLALAPVLASTVAHAAPPDYWKHELLFAFDGGPAGHYPLAGLVEASKGQFWGTALGGQQGDGVVYKFSPGGSPQVMHVFEGPDGRYPAAPLLLQGDTLYGTTRLGGDIDQGTVFSITKAGQFSSLAGLNSSTGYESVAPLVQGTDGKLYGTGSFGGDDGNGAVFRIDTAGNLALAHAFHDLRGGGTEGRFPYAPLVQHPNGNLYGTTIGGGLWGHGSIFKLSPSGQMTLLRSFTSDDALGCTPQTGLTLTPSGNMVGTNSLCGAYGGGTLFTLSPEGKVALLHTFSPRGQGGKPLGGLVRGSDGRFYGTTSQGAAGCGTVFSKSADAQGSFKLLYTFPADGSAGCDPRGTLIFGQDGALYGTTTYGGPHIDGTLFRLRHVQSPGQ